MKRHVQICAGVCAHRHQANLEGETWAVDLLGRLTSEVTGHEGSLGPDRDPIRTRAGLFFRDPDLMEGEVLVADPDNLVFGVPSPRFS